MRPARSRGPALCGAGVAAAPGPRGRGKPGSRARLSGWFSWTLKKKKKKPRKIRCVFPGVYESNDAEFCFVLLRRYGLSETL